MRPVVLGGRCGGPRFYMVGDVGGGVPVTERRGNVGAPVSVGEVLTNNFVSVRVILLVLLVLTVMSS